jgi:uncharacterized ubiquitin-like protein YukD
MNSQNYNKNIIEKLINDYNNGNKDDRTFNCIIDLIIDNIKFNIKPCDFGKYNIEIKSNILKENQHLLDYEILSKLIYHNKFLIQNINENHKYYKELKELFEFLIL